MTKTQIATAQTGRIVALEGGRTLEMLIKYGVWYAIIDTPFGMEYYGPLEDLEAWSSNLFVLLYVYGSILIHTNLRENSYHVDVHKNSSNNYSHRVHWSA